MNPSESNLEFQTAFVFLILVFKKKLLELSRYFPGETIQKLMTLLVINVLKCKKEGLVATSTLKLTMVHSDNVYPKITA